MIASLREKMMVTGHGATRDDGRHGRFEKPFIPPYVRALRQGRATCARYAGAHCRYSVITNFHRQFGNFFGVPVHAGRAPATRARGPACENKRISPGAHLRESDSRTRFFAEEPRTSS